MQESTRITNTSATYIDLIVTNIYNLEPLNTENYPIISDHKIIGTEIGLNLDEESIAYICYTRFKHVMQFIL